ncbi:MAG: hypothetical protein J6O49_07650, partial [Bacteroidaceae bacterium]|nr:hypothetical protein [Bacteroidaceae bacterium]
MKHCIKFYPVGNGDCSLVTIAGANKKMMFDCNFRQDAENEDNEMFNVFDDLLTIELTSKKCGLPFLDAFLLTHPDQDHCRNFAEKFFLGNPDNIKQADKDDKKILIGELWYSPRVFEEQTNELNADAKAFKKEAKRRMNLYKSDPDNANKDGNRIRIIGWTDNPDLEGLDERIVTPGNTISEINGSNCRYFEMFIHAPFKDDIKNADRNETSIVTQLRFKSDNNKEDIARIFLAGDAEWHIWDKIMSITEDDDYLHWDLLEAPHHCSYTFFAESRDDEPNQASLDFLDKREDGAFVVSSSNVIKKNSINPPCQKAKNRYTERVGESNFFCTSGEKDDDAETPIIFDIEDGEVGLRKDTDKEKESRAAAVTGSSKPHFYGQGF